MVYVQATFRTRSRWITALNTTTFWRWKRRTADTNDPESFSLTSLSNQSVKLAGKVFYSKNVNFCSSNFYNPLNSLNIIDTACLRTFLAPVIDAGNKLGNNLHKISGRALSCEE